MERQELIKRIEDLPSDRLTEVEDSVESLTCRDDDLDRKDLHQALSDYAIQHAGTEADLDEELEAVTVEEAIEEIALSRAIDEGQNSPPAKREEVMAILSASYR